jgi:hypothetical protein
LTYLESEIDAGADPLPVGPTVDVELDNENGAELVIPPSVADVRTDDEVTVPNENETPDE